MVKVALICKNDSSLKITSYVANAFNSLGHSTTTFILDVQNKQYNELIKQFDLKGKVTFVKSHKKFLDSNELLDFDVIHIITFGSYIQQLFSNLGSRNLNRKRPLIVTGLIGTLGGDLYQCYSVRQLADIFYVGGEFDKARLLEAAEKYGDDPDKIVNTGLPMFDEFKRSNAPKDPNKRESIVFAGQPTYPANRIERKWLIKSLLDLARKYPEKDIILKPRVKPNEGTIHVSPHHFEEILQDFDKKNMPSNFKVTYTDIRQLINSCDLLLTISSTAAYEAMVAGKNVGFITDFGIVERYGNHIFVDSGAMISFTEMINGKMPAIKPDWVEYVVNMSGEASMNVCKAILERLESKKEQLESGKFEPYYAMESTHPMLVYARKVDAPSNKGKVKNKNVSRSVTPKRNIFLKNMLIKLFKVLRRNQHINRLILKSIDHLKDVYRNSH